MRRLTASLVALLGLVVASPAYAAATVAPIRSPFIGGPVFAGERIAWAAPATGGGYDVNTQEPDGSGVVTQHVPAPGVPPRSASLLRLEASGQRVGLGIDAFRCEVSDCHTMVTEPSYRGRLSAPPGQPLQPVGSGCTSRDDCAGPHYCRSTPLVDVYADAMAYSSCAATLVVHDFAPGASPVEREFSDADQGRLAGSMAAARLPAAVLGGHDQVAVRNWRTGAELYRFEIAYQFDVQDDGKLAFIRQVPHPHTTRYEIDWASPSEPVPHPVATVDDPVSVLRIAGNRIAFMVGDGLLGQPNLQVRSLDGTLVASAPANASAGGLDFDGTRATWAEEPCKIVSILTWDLPGAAPSVPHNCPPARALTRRARIAHHHKLRLKLSCMPDPRLGCTGDVTVTALTKAHHHPRQVLAKNLYSLDPGIKRTLKLGLGKRRFCADRKGKVRARVTTTAYDRAIGGQGASRSHVLRLRGPGLRKARCT